MYFPEAPLYFPEAQLYSPEAQRYFPEVQRHLGTLRKQFAHFIRRTPGESAVPMGKLFTHGSLAEGVRFL